MLCFSMYSSFLICCDSVVLHISSLLAHPPVTSCLLRNSRPTCAKFPPGSVHQLRVDFLYFAAWDALRDGAHNAPHQLPYRALQLANTRAQWQHTLSGPEHIHPLLFDRVMIKHGPDACCEN